MTKLLLILVLFGPGDKAAGDRVAAQIGELGGKSVRVIAGPEAAKELDARGLKDGDLVSSPELGEQLTRKDELLVVRLEGRKTVGDDVVETTVWARGHTQRHVSIAGAGSDAVDGAIRGVIAIVGPMLPEPDDRAAEDARLAQYVDTGEGEGLLQLVAPFGPPPARPHSARWAYSEVRALVRLAGLDRAEDALARLRAAYPNHFLTEAAASLIPPRVNAPEPEPVGK